MEAPATPPTSSLALAPTPPATPATSTTSTAGAGPFGTLLETTATTVKPGSKTSEHVLAYVALALTAAYSSGLIPTDGIVAKIAACAAAVLISLGYFVSRTMVKMGAMLVVVFLAFGGVPMTACGPSSNKATATTTIRTTYAITKAAEAAFIAYDHDHQLAIIAAAKTGAQADAETAAYLKKRATVTTAFKVAYDAEAAAVALADDPKSVANLATVYAALFAALKDLGVSL